MRHAVRVFLTMAWLVGGAGTVLAQGSASTGHPLPDSNMGKPSGNSGDANNGIGHQGSLTGNNGSHSSTVTGKAAAAQIVTSPKAPTGDRNNPKVEDDPAQGGSKPPTGSKP